MSASYRKHVCAAIASALPAHDLRSADRATRDRRGWYARTAVWLPQALSRGATLAERFAEARGWPRALAPALRLAGTYQGFVQALRRRAEALSFWLHPPPQERQSGWPRGGVAFLVRVGGNVELLTRPGVRSRAAADTADLWPPKYRGRRPPVVLRHLVAGAGRRRVHLLTNVLSPRALSREQAADSY